MPNSEQNINLRESIARIDERTLTLLKAHEDFRDTLRDQMNNIYNDVEKHYTKKADFEPVRKLVFGFVGFMLISIGGMFIGIIVKNNSSAHDTSLQKQIEHSVIKPPLAK
jgi:hypothetical protein